MTQKHLLKLENCSRDGALQYLIVRDRKRTYSVYLLHVLKRTQSLLLVTKIQRDALNFHGAGQTGPRNLDQLKEFLIQHARQELSLVTDMQKRQSFPSKKESRAAYVKSWREKKKKKGVTGSESPNNSLQS